MAKQKNKLSNILNARYKVVVLHEDTFEEKAALRGKLWYWLTGTLSVIIVLIMLTIVLIRSTPLREYVIADSLSGYERTALLEAYTRIDSMEHIARAHGQYLDNIKQVISGNAGETAADVQKNRPTNDVVVPSASDTTNMGLSEDELALRELVESGAPYDLAENPGPARTGIASYTFYNPIKGIISSSFSAEEQHYAVDIAVKQNEPVRSTLSGHVVFASYTPETGYVVIVQHGNNLLSLYKHCASIIKKVGSFVRGGEVIAFAGNTGSLTTGPHLHFELWYNGNPVDPTNYIAF